MLETYEDSGRCGTTFLLLGVGCLLLAALLGVAYQFAVDRIPLIWIDGVITLGCALLVRHAVGKVHVLGRCRNATATLLLGVLFAGVVVTASHVTAWKIWQAEVVQHVLDDAEREMHMQDTPDQDREAAQALETARLALGVSGDETTDDVETTPDAAPRS